MNIPASFTLQQCDTVMVEKNTMPYMKSLYSCLNRIKGDGYTEDFEKSSQGVYSRKTGQQYLAKDFRVINFFRFEGNENEQDNVMMYMIETIDGMKGTLTKTFESTDDLKMA